MASALCMRQKRVRVPDFSEEEKLKHYKELCKLIKQNNGPIEVEEFANKYGWMPGVQSGRSYTTFPSLEKYMRISNSLVYALPLEEDWKKLRAAMEKSPKIQTHETKDRQGFVKEFKFLLSEDFMEEYAKIFCIDKGFVQLGTKRDAKMIRLAQTEKHWLTNHNGKYYLNELPQCLDKGRYEKQKEKKGAKDPHVSSPAILESSLKLSANSVRSGVSCSKSTMPISKKCEENSAVAAAAEVANHQKKPSGVKKKKKKKKTTPNARKEKAQSIKRVSSNPHCLDKGRYEKQKETKGTKDPQVSSPAILESSLKSSNGNGSAAYQKKIGLVETATEKNQNMNQGEEIEEDEIPPWVTPPLVFMTSLEYWRATPC